MELKYVRILIQFLNCMMGFGGYYLSDLPGAVGTGAEGTIESHFIHHNKTYTQGMNLGLYSAYAWPSVLVVFSGIVVDSFIGLRKSALLFAALTFFGALLFWFGVIATNYPLMVLSRVILGFGAESVTVVQSAYVTRWFKMLPLGLSIAQSFSVTFLRLAAAANFLISPVVGEHSGAPTACFIAVIVGVFSLGSSIGVVILDSKAETSGQLPDAVATTATGLTTDDQVGEADKQEGEGGATATTGGRKKLSCSAIKEIPLTMWIVCLISLLVYCAMFPLISIAENFFQVQYGFSHEASGRPVSAYQITSAVGLLFSGFAVDYVGRHSVWLIVALSLITSVHVFFLTTTVTPYFPMVVMAFGYFSMVSSLWTVPPYLVPESMIGVSYGMMTATLNLGLGVFPLASGAILDAHTPPKAAGKTQLPTDDGYRIVLILFASVGGLGLLACIWLFIVDRRRTRVLFSSRAQRKQMKETLSDMSEPLTGGVEGEERLREVGINNNDDEGDTELKSANRLSMPDANAGAWNGNSMDSAAHAE